MWRHRHWADLGLRERKGPFAACAIRLGTVSSATGALRGASSFAVNFLSQAPCSYWCVNVDPAVVKCLVVDAMLGVSRWCRSPAPRFVCTCGDLHEICAHRNWSCGSAALACEPQSGGLATAPPPRSSSRDRGWMEDRRLGCSQSDTA